MPPVESPFPGMDPYLEQHCGDVHHRLVQYIADQLQAGLPDDLRARVEERVFVATEAGERRLVAPDVRVIERHPSSSAPPRSDGDAGVAVMEPLIIHLPLDPITEGYIEVLDIRAGRRVVTVIEVLSPANKTGGRGQDLYIQTQQEVLASDANLVEIDLLRAGHRVLAVSPDLIPRPYRTPYLVCVTRGRWPDRAEVYPIPPRERMPAIKVPLREADHDVPLDLQAAVSQVYRNGRYDDIDYTVEPEPPLDPQDAAWADALLRSKGLR